MLGPLSAPMLRRADATKISRRDEESAIPVFMRSLIPSHCSLTRGHLGIGLPSPVRSPSQEWMHEGEMSRLGKWGLIVPAKTAEPSSSINRVNALASASVANIFVSRARLRCLGRTPRLRSNVTYQVGVIAPSSPVLQHSSLRRFGDDYLAAHEIENVAGHLTCVPAAAKGLVTHKIVLACVLDRRDRDEEVGWRVLTTRRLLADLSAERLAARLIASEKRCYRGFSMRRAKALLAENA